MSDHHTNYFF